MQIKCPAAGFSDATLTDLCFHSFPATVALFLSFEWVSFCFKDWTLAVISLWIRLLHVVITRTLLLSFFIRYFFYRHFPSFLDKVPEHKPTSSSNVISCIEIITFEDAIYLFKNMLPREKGGEGRTGIWGLVDTNYKFGMDKQWGPTVQHREP